MPSQILETQLANAGTAHGQICFHHQSNSWFQKPSRWTCFWDETVLFLIINILTVWKDIFVKRWLFKNVQDHFLLVKWGVLIKHTFNSSRNSFKLEHVTTQYGHGTLLTVFHTPVHDRWPRTEESGTQQSHAGPDWLPGRTAHLQHRGCSCSVLSCVYMCPFSYVRVPCTGCVWPQLSLSPQGSLGWGWPLS